jgi:hypothetical protein
VVISYHVHLTYQNQAAQDREAFYSTGLTTPYIIFDGAQVVWEMNPSNYDSMFRQAVEIARTTEPYFNLAINNAIASQSNASLDLMIVAADTIPDDELICCIAILQDSLPGAYTTFYRICQEFYEFPLELSYPDTLDTTFSFSHNIPLDKMRVVLFVKNLANNEIMQGTMSFFQEE